VNPSLIRFECVDGTVAWVHPGTVVNLRERSPGSIRDEHGRTIICLANGHLVNVNESPDQVAEKLGARGRTAVLSWSGALVLFGDDT
jgi:hypothetical protein